MSDVGQTTPCITHRLFFIRHGETVDNVAGLYAGIRDSALTVHGVHQASRLAYYLAREGHRFTNVFSSDLTRAVRTAEAILKAQPSGTSSQHTPHVLIKIIQLREQDFGFYEGKPFHVRSPSSKSGRESHFERNKDEPGVQAPESKESMMRRADEFLDQHLLPLVYDSSSDLVIAVVSHGMLLSALWKSILRRQRQHSVTVNPEIIANSRPVILEHLGGWSNTGYLEILLREEHAPSAAKKNVEPTLSVHNPGIVLQDGITETDSGKLALRLALEATLFPISVTSRAYRRFALDVRTINVKAHLQGLRRTGGGIGSSKFDDSQQSIKSFFKKQKQD